VYLLLPLIAPAAYLAALIVTIRLVVVAATVTTVSAARGTRAAMVEP
jgi:hypothetical protein